MDILDEYSGLVNGEPLRIKQEDMTELMRITSLFLGACAPYINGTHNTTDVLQISRAVNELINNYNRISRAQSELMMLLNKILNYNKK